MRFRRISFPVSAMSILAISLYFFHGLNFGIDFEGGTLIEVQTKEGHANLAKMRTKLSGSGSARCRSRVRRAQRHADPHRRAARRRGGTTRGYHQGARGARQRVEYRRVEVVGPRVSGELLSNGMIGLGVAIFCILVYLWFRFEWQFALGAMIANVHDIVLTIGFMSVTQIDSTSPASRRCSPSGLFAQRHGRDLRPYSRDAAALQEDADAGPAQRLGQPDAVALGDHARHRRLALLALLLFGGQAIHSFTATMMFGVVLVGTYTSVFIASPILIYLGVGRGGDALTRAGSDTSKKKP